MGQNKKGRPGYVVLKIECCLTCNNVIRIRESKCCGLTKDDEDGYEEVSPIGHCGKYAKPK